METHYRATLRLDKVEPSADGNSYRREHTTELAAITVTGDTPADAMVQLCAHADSLYDWHLQQANSGPADLLHEAWALIANAGWDAHRGITTLDKSPGWHDAAIRWRDRYHAGLDDTPAERPAIVVLCGSTRFAHAFREANLRETLAGNIVLSIGCDMRSDGELLADLDDAGRAKVKADLDQLHKRKIDLADEVLVLNVGGYVGESTLSEIDYAITLGKPIRWLEPSTVDTPEQIAERADSIRQTDGTAADQLDAATAAKLAELAHTAWCGNPDHTDPCDDCDTALVGAAEELRRRMPGGCDNEPFVEVLQEPEKPICGDPHHRHTGPCEVYAPLTPCGCGPTHARDCPMGIGAY